MREPAIPVDEKDRQAALDATGWLDSAPTERFDRYTRLVRRLFGVPIALISLVDRDRQWFKSRQGISAIETPRNISFCGHAIAESGLLVVENATGDERFHDNPLVENDPKIRFYAGCPIETPDGHKIGTLCIIDDQPREFSEADKEALKDIGAMVSDELTTMRLASIDDLTGLSNRRAFHMLANQSIKAARRNQHDAVLIMIDLDGFKAINDKLGHAAGDKALIEFAGLMKTVFRDSDILARLGGDEFCVLLAETDRHSAGFAIDRFFNAVEERNDRTTRNNRLAFSAGVIEFDKDAYESIEEMLTDADALMYQRKRAKSQP